MWASALLHENALSIAGGRCETFTWLLSVKNQGLIFEGWCLQGRFSSQGCFRFGRAGSFFGRRSAGPHGRTSPQGPAAYTTCHGRPRPRSLRSGLSSAGRSASMVPTCRSSPSRGACATAMSMLSLWTPHPTNKVLDLLPMGRSHADSQRPGSPSAGCHGVALRARCLQPTASQASGRPASPSHLVWPA